MVMPAVLLVLASCIGGIQLSSQQARLQDAAADVARSWARDDAGSGAAGVLARISGARAVREDRGELVCAELRAPGSVALLELELSASSCALGGGR